MSEPQYTLPEELLKEVAAQIKDNPYTLQELDDTAMWIAAGPIAAAASAGLAVNAEHAIYYTAGIFAGSMLAEYVNLGLIDPSKISHYVNVTLPESIQSREKKPKKKK